MRNEGDLGVAAWVPFAAVLAGLACAHVLYERWVADDAIAAFIFGAPLALVAMGGSSWLGTRRAIGDGSETAWRSLLGVLLPPLWWWAMVNVAELAETLGVQRSMVVGAASVATAAVAALWVLAARAGVRSRSRATAARRRPPPGAPPRRLSAHRASGGRPELLKW